jgi:tetratricopeptide (TPR) repeat protein
VYLNLGFLYIKSDRFAAAEAALRASLAISEGLFGPEAPALGKPLHALGKVARELGRLDESLTTLERATTIFVAAFGENSNEVAAAVTDLGVTQHLLGRYVDASDSFDRVEAIYASLYPEGHRHLGGLFERRCRMLIDAHRYADAVAACERGLELGARMQLRLAWRVELGELAVAAARGLGDASILARLSTRLDVLRDAAALSQ